MVVWRQRENAVAFEIQGASDTPASIVDATRACVDGW